jgi:hypothetical protein
MLVQQVFKGLSTVNAPIDKQQGRRMTDQVLDSAAQAVRIEQLTGRQALLEQQVKSSMDALTNMLSTAQLEIRNMTNKFGEIATIQHSQDTNRLMLDELKQTVISINTRLEAWFNNFDIRNNQRWEQYERERNEWRIRHEQENEGSIILLDKEIRSVRETVIRSLGWCVGFGAVGSLLIVGFLWTFNDRFTMSKNDIAETKDAMHEIAAKVEDGKDKTTEIELYLARGGVNPQEPYKTKQQQGRNGNGK